MNSTFQDLLSLRFLVMDSCFLLLSPSEHSKSKTYCLQLLQSHISIPYRSPAYRGLSTTMKFNKPQLKIESAESKQYLSLIGVPNSFPQQLMLIVPPNFVVFYLFFHFGQNLLNYLLSKRQNKVVHSFFFHFYSPTSRKMYVKVSVKKEP